MKFLIYFVNFVKKIELLAIAIIITLDKINII